MTILDLLKKDATKEQLLEATWAGFTYPLDQVVKRLDAGNVVWEQRCHVRWDLTGASTKFLLDKALSSLKIDLARSIRELSAAGAKELFGDSSSPYRVMVPDLRVEDPKARLNRAKSTMASLFGACTTLAEAEELAQELGLSEVPEPWGSSLK